MTKPEGAARPACSILWRIPLLASVGVMVYLILYYLLDTTAARMQLEDRTDICVESLTWIVRMVAAGGVCLILWPLIRIRHWDFAVSCFAAVGALFMAVVVFGWQESWPAFGYKDSQTQLVPRALINDYLFSGVGLPPHATGIRAFICGGINPQILLKFRAEPHEAKAFVDKTLNAVKMGQADLNRGGLPDWLWEGQAKEWWTPKRGLPWWYQHWEVGNALFIQHEEAAETVYVWHSVQ